MLTITWHLQNSSKDNATQPHLRVTSILMLLVHIQPLLSTPRNNVEIVNLLITLCNQEPLVNHTRTLISLELKVTLSCVEVSAKPAEYPPEII